MYEASAPRFPVSHRHVRKWTQGWTSTQPWRWRSFPHRGQPLASGRILSGVICANGARSGNTTFIAADAHLDTFVVKRAKEEEDEAGALDWDSATTMI
jgi:hypothetical protein